MTDITVLTIMLQKRNKTMSINHTAKISINYTTEGVVESGRASSVERRESHSKVSLKASKGPPGKIT
jgi:hypothetical protein